MKGLLRKDLYGLRQGLFSMLFVLIFWALLFYKKGSGAAFVIPMCMMIGVLYSMSLFTQDRLAGWDEFELSLPISRKAIVTQRYMSSLIASLVCGIAATIIVMASAIEAGEGIGKDVLINLGVNWETGMLLSIVYLSVSIPLTYWLGVEKARIITSILMGAIFFVLLLSLHFLESLSVQENEIRLMMLAGCMVCGMLAASYYISLKIFEKKEF